MKRILIIGSADEKSNIAQPLAKSGNKIILADPWSLTTENLPGLTSVFPIRLNDRDAVFEAFKNIDETLGGIDIMIFAVAASAAFKLDEAGEISATAWRDSINNLLYGGFYATQAALRRMIPQQSGSIIYLCADNAVNGNIREPSLAAANCGLLALSCSLAASVFRHGVTMNSLILGAPFAAVEELPSIPEDSGREEFAYAPKASFPMIREQTLHRLHERAHIGWQESVAAMISHLCSDEGGMIMGSTLRLANVGKHSPLLRWTY